MEASSGVDQSMFMRLVSTLLVVCGVSSATVAESAALFTSVQPELFAAPRALSSAWADFDGDGDLDLAVSFSSGEIRLYRNDQGRFVNVGDDLGFPVKGAEVRGLAWGDFDGDGYVDLYAATAGNSDTVSLLFRNESGRRFVEVASAMGVATPGMSSRQPIWVDYDNDGDLDLYVTQRSGSNRLYRNDGGRFADVSAETGLGDPRRSVGACWFDFDQDGDLDVFIANQQGDKDGFYRNDDGAFSDIAAQLDMHQPQRTLDEGGVSCAVGDYDNDGDFDLFVATYGESLLYRNEGQGVFREVADEMGIAGRKHAVGLSWGDYDNDGRIDLYIAAYDQTYRPANHLLRNEGGRFVDMLMPGSPLNVADHGVYWADYDQDGDLDLSLTQGFSKEGGHPVLRNELAQSRRSNSLQVLVLDRNGHATRAGAEVRLYDQKNILLGSRLVSTGEGYNAQGVLPVHFGLEGLSPVAVEVTFMTRAGRSVQRTRNVDPRSWVGKPFIIKENP